MFVASFVSQLRVRSETQEKELKEQVSCVQEEARKQTEAMASQLNSKSSQLLAKERELADTQ